MYTGGDGHDELLSQDQRKWWDFVSQSGRSQEEIRFRKAGDRTGLESGFMYIH